MSPQNSNSHPGGSYRKPRIDVYTLLLAIALVAIILGIVCFYLEMGQYDFKFKGSPRVAIEPSSRVASVDLPAYPWYVAGPAQHARV